MRSGGDVKQKRALALAALGAVFLGAQGRDQMVEWPHYGGDAGHGKYSVAADITAANAGDLELAWTWQTADRPMPAYNVRPGGFETTPIMIDDVLYASTSFHQVAALNPETGEQLWLFDPRTYEEGPPLSGTGLNSRGVAFWRGDNGESRIFIAGRQRLFAIDARSGKPVATFAGGGAAALNENLGRDVPRLHTQVTSPPVVYRNLVIIGTGVPDRLQYRGDPPGTVQAFDVRTGARVWVFFTIPQSPADFGADTWGNESWRIAGHANVWAPMSLDEARGLLYSADLDAERRLLGRLAARREPVCRVARLPRRAHRSAPLAFPGDPPRIVGLRLRIRADARDVHRRRTVAIDVVAQVSKQGFTYVFDRVTGRPVWPIEERPVDTTTDVPGERVFPTQPFPTRPPPLVPQGISLGRCERSDAGDQTARRGAAESLPARAALHAAEPQGNDPAAVAERRGELGRRGVRSRNGAAVRQGGRQLPRQHALQERPAGSVRHLGVQQLLRAVRPLHLASATGSGRAGTTGVADA